MPRRNRQSRAHARALEAANAAKHEKKLEKDAQEGKRLPSMKITMKLKKLVATKTRVKTGRASWILKSLFKFFSVKCEEKGTHPNPKKVKPKPRAEKRATQTTSAPRNLLLQ